MAREEQSVPRLSPSTPLLQSTVSSPSSTTISQTLRCMHILTPNHVQLISACYPPSSALLTAGPDYSPNSQELSRLTYYAANRPGKISKLGNELEKRVKAESRKAAAGNTRARAYVISPSSIPGKPSTNIYSGLC